ncbi:glycerol-3-phosphate dehydrogenase (NAD(P)+) [Octadecabacter temperatus]|uniref:Glycerol-3-phosphate dehydrogenase [NAD(P)+] n=1 Tax=Octadecabacter temperatus TaxID=1458307 RepID=A0A0K0YA09_9RHOB|nr:NAD(P)H-dependent glycerol-3-phosphate dehydrogenase [Octadecabacter temperatus]AKS47756.1 Glycerol-3-phosphate dehydrogenase [NAD(P)+] [Octadecabacter temperatus]SIO38923.1 glycerol-3-phosphate dehydrogenase (NAD(P)+) [Octadecabacter temperatus]
MKLAVAGAGAFGTGLAISLAANGPVTLWARDADAAAEISKARENVQRLPGHPLPENINVTSNLAALIDADTILLAIPAQKLGEWLKVNADHFADKRLVACCKGIDQSTLRGPVAQIEAHVPSAICAMLTGPSFAADIANHLPTALTLACNDVDEGAYLQACLSTPTLRLYLSQDVIGAELGGALKNVIAIACGVCMGAGFGESARAAVITRGFAEMRRIGTALGADPETLTGLSGFGDLALTCTSDGSRNYRFGLSIGSAQDFDTATTVEGAATAVSVSNLAQKHDLDLPICRVVADLASGKIDPETALATLLARPLRKE